jgi:hypothetical protein
VPKSATNNKNGANKGEVYTDHAYDTLINSSFYLIGHIVISFSSEFGQRSY